MNLDQVEDQLVAYVTRLLVLAKIEVFEAFYAKDQKGAFRVTKQQWASTLEQTLGDQFPWDTLLWERLGLAAQAELDGTVCYSHFLRRFQIEFKGVGRHSGWVDEVLNLMTEVLLEKDVSLTSLESLFDPDEDGVDADDFRRIDRGSDDVPVPRARGQRD